MQEKTEYHSIDDAATALQGYDKCQVGVTDSTIIVTANWSDPDCRHWQKSVFAGDGEHYTWLGYEVDFR